VHQGLPALEAVAEVFTGLFVGGAQLARQVVLFLVEERSSHVNGTVVAVHGGERSLLPG
jgi:hypothetical protein